MRSVHVVDLADYLKVTAQFSRSGLLVPTVSINHSRIMQLLAGVEAGEPLVFVMRVDRLISGASGVPCMQQQLHASNAQSEFFPVDNVDRHFVRSQLAYIFGKRKLPLYLMEYDIKGDGATCFGLTPAETMTYSLSRPMHHLKALPAEQIRHYTSREDFAASVAPLLPRVEVSASLTCAAPGQMWPKHKAQFLDDLRAKRVRRVFCDVDNTLMMTDWMSYREHNACQHCDRVYAQLLKADRHCRMRYDQGMPASERYRALKAAIVKHFEHDKIDAPTLKALYQNLNGVNDSEIYRARLDLWFNRFYEQVYLHDPKDAQRLRVAYLKRAQSAAGLFEAEADCLLMLMSWKRSDNPREVEMAARALQDLQQSMSVISYRSFVSNDVMQCLRKAQLGRVDTRISTMRAKPRAGSRAEQSPVSLSVVVPSINKAWLIKPDAQMMKMVASASYLDGHRNRCHIESGCGESLGPVHPSSKILYHTIELLLSGQRFRTDQQHLLYLFDDRSHETHPQLVEQCNALLKHHGYGHVAWRTVVLCQGGELLSAGLPHLDHRATADHSELMCEHCIPARLFEHVRDGYRQAVAEARAAGRAEAGFDPMLYQHAYQQAWARVVLMRSTPSVAGRGMGAAGHASRQAAALTRARTSAQQSVTRATLADMTAQLQAVAERRAAAKAAAAVAAEHKPIAGHIKTQPVIGKIDWASIRTADDIDSNDDEAGDLEEMLLSSIELGADAAKLKKSARTEQAAVGPACKR